MWAELSIEGLDRPRSYSFASAPKNENLRNLLLFEKYLVENSPNGYLMKKETRSSV